MVIFSYSGKFDKPEMSGYTSAHHEREVAE
jgi:hypothetical protein